MPLELRTVDLLTEVSSIVIDTAHLETNMRFHKIREGSRGVKEFLQRLRTHGNRQLPSILPPPPLPLSKLGIPNTSLPEPKAIPNIVHYVYLYDDNYSFPYWSYLSARSVLVHLRPKVIMMHCLNEPKGYWWDQVREGAKELGVEIDVHHVRDVTWVGKDKRPVWEGAHKADILRLEALIEHGGIYLDLDVYIIRPFAETSLMYHDVVMGIQGEDPGLGPPEEYADKDEGYGLCNALFMARPGAEFLKRWMTTYEEGFDGKQWDWNSVMSWKLARLYPELIHLLSDRAFFWPLYDKEAIKLVYETEKFDFQASGQLAYHGWNNCARDRLKGLDPTKMRNTNNSFTNFARTLQAPDEERKWLEWKVEQGSDLRGESPKNRFSCVS